MLSLQKIITNLTKCIDKDFTEWENSFVKDITEKIKNLKSTDFLTDKQIHKLEQIHKKYF